MYSVRQPGTALNWLEITGFAGQESDSHQFVPLVLQELFLFSPRTAPASSGEGSEGQKWGADPLPLLCSLSLSPYEGRAHPELAFLM